jgi:hypothetical protein
MLTTNLEPVYGIILAYFILGGKENEFWIYIGALIIVIVILNGCYKHYEKGKQEELLFWKQTFIHKYKFTWTI